MTGQNGAPSLETEIKIEVADLDAIRTRLSEIGAVKLSVVDEENLYFDRDGILAERQESFRLRRDSRSRLTWKGPGNFKSGVIQRPEIEIAVSDYDRTVELLERLGFEPVERLIKQRETWRVMAAEVSLDLLEFGSFVEIEADRDTARAVATRLGLDLDHGLRSSYRQIRRERDPNR